MAEQRAQRRLAAIMAADVAEYSRLMHADEAGTIAAWQKARRDAIDPTLEAHNGRVVKRTGDGFLAEFATVEDAVRCAVAMQRALDDGPLKFRIGINLGDITDDGEDIYGDGVNIAARLEGIAEPGGISISGGVYDQIHNKLNLDFIDLGEQSVKNIARPVRVYRIGPSHGREPDDAIPISVSIFQRPAVAVLPFENLSGDAEQDYFADGLTEDIITALSLWRSFPVIARNSTFAYKDKSPDIRKVGEELSARYVVEGSVRKSGTKVRVTAQLINAETGHHVWAERYDRDVTDIFELQDEIARAIAATIEPHLVQREQQRLAASPPSRMDAWGYYQRGMGELQALTREGNANARAFFEKAISLDPSYGQAYAGLAFSHHRDIIMNYVASRSEAIEAMRNAADRAVTLDNSDATAHILLGLSYLFQGQHDFAVLEGERSVALNPGNYFALVGYGVILDTVGRTSEAIRFIENGLKLNPNNPRQHIYLARLARAHMNAKNYDKAVEWGRKAVSRKPDDIDSRLVLSAALGHLGHSNEAMAYLSDCPVNRIKLVRERTFWGIFRDTRVLEHVIEGLRKAGIPE